jgi:hypothetical protein
MASVVERVKATGTGVGSVTTGAVTPGGSDRLAFATIVSYGDDVAAVKYGGSGGTDLDNVLASADITFFAVKHSAWAKAGSPAGSTTGFADWAPNTETSALALFMFLTGADQTTPLDTSVTAAADPGSEGDGDAVAEIVLTGLNPGQLVIASLAISPIGGLDSIVANNGDTHIDDSAGVNGGVPIGGANLWGNADGSGNLTLSVTIVETSPPVLIGWRLKAYPVNNAAGGAASILLQVMQHGGA